MTVEYCFPNHNLSCVKELQARPDNLFWVFFLSCISVFTVLLNLLVIISISHFNQLHTPTNLLILSLAVADLLTGLIVMPVRIMELINKCWYFGNLACSVFLVINVLSPAASICSVVFISVDRYIAITDPLRYSTKVTVCRMSLFIILGWYFSLLYVTLFLYFNDHLLQSRTFIKCEGECSVPHIKFSWFIVDLFVFFLTPCSVILTLYSNIFNVARHQAKAVRAFPKGASQRHRAKMSNSTETKAAKTLGIVIFVYLACWIPFYLISLTFDTVTVVWSVFSWLMYIFSSVNPLIYAIFYPWFRASVRCILTLKIFKSSSSMLNLFAEHI